MRAVYSVLQWHKCFWKADLSLLPLSCPPLMAAVLQDTVRNLAALTINYGTKYDTALVLVTLGHLETSGWLALASTVIKIFSLHYYITKICVPATLSLLWASYKMWLTTNFAVASRLRNSYPDDKGHFYGLTPGTDVRLTVVEAAMLEISLTHPEKCFLWSALVVPTITIFISSQHDGLFSSRIDKCVCICCFYLRNVGFRSFFIETPALVLYPLSFLALLTLLPHPLSLPAFHWFGAHRIFRFPSPYFAFCFSFNVDWNTVYWCLWR